MTGATAQITDRDLVELLRERGYRVTSQRLLILRELRRRSTHSTAEEIHAAVRESLPGTATPTVYATLDLLVDLGLVRRIDAGGPALYDARMDPHQHAVCRHCARVFDVDGHLDAEPLLSEARAVGFSPDRTELVIRGLCRECSRASGPGPRGVELAGLEPATS